MGREGSHNPPPDRPPNPVYRKEIPHPRQPIMPFIQRGWGRPRSMAGEAAGPRCLRKEVLGGANTILRYAVSLNGRNDIMGLFVGVPFKLCGVAASRWSELDSLLKSRPHSTILLGQSANWWRS